MIYKKKYLISVITTVLIDEGLIEMTYIDSKFGKKGSIIY